MAEELGKFVPYVGGPSQAHTLLVPLETLSTVEETVVREKAVESLNSVAAELPESAVAEQYIPLVKVHTQSCCMSGQSCCMSGQSSCTLICVSWLYSLYMQTHVSVVSQRLATGEWFTSRVSACSTFASAYPRAPPPLRAELRTLFAQLCRDETPMVSLNMLCPPHTRINLLTASARMSSPAVAWEPLHSAPGSADMAVHHTARVRANACCRCGGRLHSIWRSSRQW